MVSFIIYDNYLYDGSVYYQLTKGLPMRNGYSGAMADLYLGYFERGTNLGVNQNRIFRYIDDILIQSFSDQRYVYDFYHKELKLIPNQEDNESWVRFLDIKLKQRDGSMEYCAYDKRDQFRFEVITVSYWHINLHYRILVNNLICQLNRLSKLCKRGEDLINRATYISNYVDVCVILKA